MWRRGRIHRRGKERVRVEHDDDGDDAGTTTTDGAVSYVRSSCYVHRNGVGMGGFSAFSSGQVYTVNITACLSTPGLVYLDLGVEMVWFAGCLDTTVMLLSFTVVCGSPNPLCNRLFRSGPVPQAVSESVMWRFFVITKLAYRSFAMHCCCISDPKRGSTEVAMSVFSRAS